MAQLDQRILHIGDRHWPARIYGSGQQLLIALHGFGEDGSIFARWEGPMGEAFTIVAVDLPHHGKANTWPMDGFRPEDVISLITYLLEDYQPSGYCLVGHSFGARILMASRQYLESFPGALWLLAPDGLATRRMGLMNRIPVPLRKWIGRSIEDHHRSWVWLAGKLHQMGWLDIFSVRYIRHHLSDEFHRQRLMGSWINLPHFPVDRDQLLKTVTHEKLPVHLVIGRKDPLIDWTLLADWLKKWPASNLHELNAGHDLINDQVAELIRSTSTDLQIF